MIFEIHPSPLTLLPLGYLMSAFQHPVRTSKQHKLLQVTTGILKKQKDMLLYSCLNIKKYIFPNLYC